LNNSASPMLNRIDDNHSDTCVATWDLMLLISSNFSIPYNACNARRNMKAEASCIVKSILRKHDGRVWEERKI
jgi:hypothetical protein